jgi:predicted AAA+ superfamily ATPase
MIERSAYDEINRLRQSFPIVAVTGPRQSGKTTLLRNKFPNYQYYNLEDPDIFNIVQNDMGGFIKGRQRKLILDEVQKIPELLSYLQVVSDDSRIMGQFLLSGSENLLLSQKISQTLAGRAAYVNLYPLSLNEIPVKETLSNYRDMIFQGFYPAIFDRNINPIDYYNQYIATYVERDVKQIVNVHNLSLFRKFLGLLAGRVGGIVNYTSLSNDVGVDIKTIESWISILEATFVIFKLPPFYENFGKRHIKSPKIYFTDTGILCRLLGIRSSAELETHSLIGALFENLVIGNFLKEKVHSGQNHEMYYYRSSSGNEVDLLLASGENIVPIEIKSSATWVKSYAKGLDYLTTLVKPSHYNICSPTIIYNGQSAQILNYSVVNYADSTALFENL